MAMEFNDEAAYGHRKWILKGGKGRRWTISLTVEEICRQNRTILPATIVSLRKLNVSSLIADLPLIQQYQV
ncbi:MULTISPECIES: hypothetical protein [Klebsiella]|uniref:hypothetical protein n=1 Tax=Klebsiella TaxID=570 RepID=UPI001055D6C9|nr:MULTISPECIES: hypothetical protein [Klebsiella]QHW97355.1 hypothetical protein GZS05_13470 [Klebsiella variicola]